MRHQMIKIINKIKCLPYTLSAVSLTVALLSGCQSMKAHPVHVHVTPALPAKDVLQQAVMGQFKKSFSYKTSVYLSPSTAPVTGEQACIATHDERYVALAKSAKKDGLDLSADRYLDDKESLKQAFLACMNDDAHDWRASDGKTKDTAVYTAQKRYLTDPVSLTITGNYRPLLGQVSALPRAEYRLGAVEMMVNQPVMVDWQAGRVYVWADNVALANATWLDKELGDKWHNKWLMLDLNDGSLPKDFVKEFAKGYFAMRQRHFNEGEFEVVGHDVLTALPTKDLPKTSLVVQGKFMNKKDHLQEFLITMSERYPMLLEADIEQDDDKENTKPTINSLYLAKRLFALLQEQMDKESNDPVQTLYGLDGKKLIWTANATPKPIANVLDVVSMTVFDDELVDVFERLPKAHQKPTTANSIDVMAYANDLLKKPHLDGSYVALFEKLLGIQSVSTD